MLPKASPSCPVKPVEAEPRLTWREACVALGRPGTADNAKALRLFIARRVKAGAPDPRIPGERYRQVTRSALLQCVKQLRPAKEQAIIREFLRWRESAEERILELAGQAFDLGIRRLVSEGRLVLREPVRAGLSPNR